MTPASEESADDLGAEPSSGSPRAEETLGSGQSGYQPVASPPVASASIDQWAESHPWHPRVGPWFLYMAILALTLQARDWQAWTYVPLKAIQVVSVCYLVWRWRSMVPELSLKFHSAVIPVSLFLVVAWIFLHRWTVALFPSVAAGEPVFFADLRGENPTLFWLAATAHLLAMCTAVPLVEETLNRSLLLRGLSDWRMMRTGILQFLCDLPVIGDWLIRTEYGAAVSRQPSAFAAQFVNCELGELRPCGVIASTAIFTLVHATGDWPGAIVCGLTWCILLSRTRHLGLGPVIWSHAAVNLLLWVHVVTSEAWQYL